MMQYQSVTAQVKTDKQITLETCEDCNGKGAVFCSSCDGEGHKMGSCDRCNGKGKGYVKCKGCNGSGSYLSSIKYKCSCCDGTGQCSSCNSGSWSKCNKCSSQGYTLKKRDCRLCENGKQLVNCSKCDGSGKIMKSCSSCNSGMKTCRSCNGKGKIKIKHY